MAARILAGLVGLAMAFSAFSWMTDPAAAAASLGMPLLDGMGRSTQIGDFGAFFVTAAALSLYGALRQETPWLLSAALLLQSAAVFRALAWLVHGAEFATAAIVAEVVMAGLLVTSAMLMRRRSATPAAPAP